MVIINTMNLPVAVSRVGGALVSVLAWEQYAQLAPETLYALGRLVGANADLNTENRVDLLADLASHHGAEFDREFIELLDEYGPERVHLAIDALYELAYRNHEGGDLTEVAQLITFIVTMRDHDYELESAEGVCSLIDKMGGLEVVLESSVTDLEQMLTDYKQREAATFEELF